MRLVKQKVKGRTFQILLKLLVKSLSNREFMAEHLLNVLRQRPS